MMEKGELTMELHKYADDKEKEAWLLIDKLKNELYISKGDQLKDMIKVGKIAQDVLNVKACAMIVLHER